MAIGESEKKEKKERNWAIALGFGLDQKMEVESWPSWAKIRPRLKEMGLNLGLG